VTSFQSEASVSTNEPDVSSYDPKRFESKQYVNQTFTQQTQEYIQKPLNMPRPVKTRNVAGNSEVSKATNKPDVSSYDPKRFESNKPKKTQKKHKSCRTCPLTG